MDYTPINARRVLVGFSLTGLFAVLPFLVIFLDTHTLPFGVAVDASGVYRALMLGVGSVVMMAALAGVVALAFAVARRAVGHVSRA